jgi:hypothetical protein
MAVIALRTAEVGEDDFIDRVAAVLLLSCRSGDPAAGLPLGEDAGIFGPAFGGVVLAQKYIAVATIAQREGNDCLTGLFVQAVTRWFAGLSASHWKNPFRVNSEDFRILRGSDSHFRPPEGSPKMCSFKNLNALPLVGLEQTPENPGNSHFSPQSAAESGAVGANPELREVVEAWPDLPEPIQAAILALVRSVAR